MRHRFLTLLLATCVALTACAAEEPTDDAAAAGTSPTDTSSTDADDGSADTADEFR